MALEDSITHLAAAVQALARAIEGQQARPAVSEYAGPDSDAAPRRGRPPGSKNRPKEEGTAEPTPPPPVAEAAEPPQTPEPAPEPIKPILLDDVRAALMALKEKDGNRDRCVTIIKKHTGQEVLTGISEAAYAPIVEDVRKLL